MKTTAKDDVRALLEKLPDDASLNDIQYHIYVRQKIERGLEAIRKGNVIPHEEIEKLSVAERVQLAEEIWDSIAATPEQLPLTEAQRQELDRRLALLEREPARATPWEEVRMAGRRRGGPRLVRRARHRAR